MFVYSIKCHTETILKEAREVEREEREEKVEKTELVGDTKMFRD